MVSVAQANRTKKNVPSPSALKLTSLAAFLSSSVAEASKSWLWSWKVTSEEAWLLGDDKVICSWNEHHEEDHVTKVSPKTWYLIDIDVLFYNAQNISPALNIA